MSPAAAGLGLAPGLGLGLRTTYPPHDPLVKKDEAFSGVLLVQGADLAFCRIQIRARGVKDVATGDLHLRTPSHDFSDSDDAPMRWYAARLVDHVLVPEDLVDVGLVVQHHTVSDHSIAALHDRDVVPGLEGRH